MAAPRITIVNTADRGGGAERGATQALEHFRDRGSHTSLVVGLNGGSHAGVIPIGASPFHDPPRRATGLAWDIRRRVERRLGFEDFAFPSTAGLLTATGQRPDVVLCFNLHGGYFNLARLPRIAAEVPVVLRLADSWPFTGHCAVPLGCERWVHGCGSCPDLAIPPAVTRDATARNWRRKRSIFSGLKLHVASPSRWLLDRARRSLLGPSITGAKVIPNGVDLGIFSPYGPRAPRGDCARLLFVAHGGAQNPYKSFPTIRGALKRLDREVELVVVGGREDERPTRAGAATIRRLPYVEDPAELAALYRSADLYVHAAPEESFSLTTAEALACGTPVAAAASGGIEEVVRHGETGLLCAPGDSAGLARAIAALLDQRGRMSAAAAADARARFQREVALDALYEFCASAAGYRPREPARAQVQSGEDVRGYDEPVV